MTLDPEQRRLLDLLLDQRGVDRRGGGLPRRPAGGPLPFSTAQRRIGLHQQQFPDDPAYNLPIGFRLEGHPNREALWQAMREIVDGQAQFAEKFINAAYDDEPGTVVYGLGMTVWASAGPMMEDELRKQRRMELIVLFVVTIFGLLAPLTGAIAGIQAYRSRTLLVGEVGTYLALGYGAAVIGVVYTIVFLLLLIGL